MKNKSRKNIIDILIIVVIVLGVREYLGKHKHINSKTKQENNVEVVDNNYQADKEQNEVSDDKPVSTKDNRPVFYIRGLGDVSQEDLQYTSEIIENFYGYNCVIERNVSIPDGVCFEGTTTINASSCVSELDTDKKTLYLTYNRLTDDGNELRGYTRINGETIIVRGDRSFMKSTIIHEIGHTLGLEHCSDMTCVMASENDAYDSGDFCENCKRIINR